MTLTIVIVLAILIGMILARVPVALALATSGAAGLWMLNGFGLATADLSDIPLKATGQYTLLMIPMFVLMGLFMSNSGMLHAVFDAAEKLTRKLPGGLGVATVLACTVFGGITGSSAADAATMGRLSIGEMGRRGYNRHYAAALVAAAGTVAMLIPPSIGLVIYGITTGESIGQLLIAGLIPGLVTAVAYVSYVIYRGWRDGQAADASTKKDVDPRSTVSKSQLSEGGVTETISAAARWYGLASCLVVFVVVIGGMYSGFFTSTEASAVGAGAAAVLSVVYLLVRRNARGIVRSVTTSLTETMSLTATIFALLLGAMVFSHFLVSARVPRNITRWILENDFEPIVVLLLFLLAALVLGMFIDGLSILLIVTPLAYPIMMELGFDGIWLGVLLVKAIEIGLLTPPVGLNVFVIAGLFKDLKVEKVFREVTPFIGVEMAVFALLIAVPGITLFLPGLMA